MKRKWLCLIPLAAANAMSVSLAPSVPSPAPLGTLVTFTATPSGASGDPVVYRFRTRSLRRTRQGSLEEPFRTVIDYGPSASFNWASIEGEGNYEIEVSALDKQT